MCTEKMATSEVNYDDPAHATIIRLNVGGSLFSTTKQTLLREENSVFAQILNSELNGLENAIVPLPDGTMFIDRDGFLFAYILEYLRIGKLILPENFHDYARLREEARFYRLDNLEEQVTAHSAARCIPIGDGTFTNPSETGGYITLSYRGTFAFGRDGQADVKFRKLHRILVCGKVALCREVFGDTLNESRDPDREGQERYTSRLYLKHQCMERACDTLAEKGFKLVATCCSGANGLLATTYGGIQGIGVPQQEFINPRNTGEFEEQRWAHYTEYIFYRDALYSSCLSPSTSNKPYLFPS